MDYFELRYESPADNRRYFYQLDGEGIRYELVSFVNAVSRNLKGFTTEDVSVIISRLMNVEGC